MEPHGAGKRNIAYLKSVPGQFISGREIARRAGGKWRYRDEPKLGRAFSPALLEKKIVETDSTRHYRLIVKEEKRTRRKNGCRRR